jgi:carbon-monoxide dehydrogenase medium subunit
MLARPGLPDFEYIKAESPQDVFRLLVEKKGKVRLLMGGTDLFIQMRETGEGPELVLDLKHLPGMQKIKYDRKKGLAVGAGVTLNQLSGDSNVNRFYPLLAQSADTVGNYQLRNRATLGGNLCNASPGADLAPAALVYEGTVTLSGPDGDRVLGLDEFLLGPGKTALKFSEYLSALDFPTPPDNAIGSYLKLGRSKMGDLAIVGVAVLGFPDAAVPAGYRFRIAVNSTAPTAYRVPEAEKTLAENKLAPEILHQAAEETMERSAPIDDVRATALYQKKMVRNLTYKGLKEIWELLKKN